MTLTRYARTLRHLRPVQIYGRVLFRVRRPRPDLRPAPAIRRPATAWLPFAWRPPLLSGADSFTFLNVEGAVRSAADWDDPSHAKLWRYNLHYFDDLNAADAASRAGEHATLVSRWIAENAPGQGTGWAPYPASLRIVNWIAWALAAPGVARLDRRALDSLAAQTRWLASRLELHLLGNHLWANAKALAFSGLFFDGAEADAWRGRGCDILARELEAQVLSDGGHFELSPMYQGTILQDVLDLLQMDRVFPGCLPTALIDALLAAAPLMGRWLRVMTHPDGEVSFFNDAAFGIAPRYAALADYAARLGLDFDASPLKVLEPLAQSGYVRMSSARAVVICDVAPLGPDFLLAHAHADTLSFELSLDGRRVLVNGGTSTYAAGPERERQRGTAAHNTVIVDEQNSSDVWASFRVARRARPLDASWTDQGGVVSVSAAHDGYRHRPGRVTHRRRWELGANALRITDDLDGRPSSARAVFHLHPDVRPEGLPIRFEPETRVRHEPDQWHPAFGTSIDSVAITAAFPGPTLRTEVAWP